MAEDVVDLCAALVRFDTTNYGNGEAEGEREAAEFVAGHLDSAGITPVLLEPAPRRTNVLARVPGTEPDLPALLVQAHLDVVPADPAEWSVPPFAGVERDGFLWGRGAVDMKDMVAMVLSVLGTWAREGRRPRRDVVLAFVADEEDLGHFGAHWLVEHHADFFAGCGTAISESGGFSHHVGEHRVYPIGTAERGTSHLRLTATGRAGHGSRRNDDNAVLKLIGALDRIAALRHPVRLTPPVRAFIERVAATLGVPVDWDDVDATVARLGPAAKLVENTVRSSTTPTVLRAGYKVNVIPGTATAEVDVRTLPGTVDELMAAVDAALGPGVRREFINHQEPVQAPVDSPAFDAMAAALRAEDPGAVVVPYCMGGGTDAKAFSRLGIDCYGFAPLSLPPGFDYRGVTHGVDERVPVEGLRFGVRVLDRFMSC
ncbi:M20/M25/M40 family metallo-hydrolase [Saccharothrix syringae]|uniref:M20/M25/M40 family metallo-hydrolase n=1 Tax=Saccharothrix syringae TaxID=103733 RepID=A0A5Q0H199_SACSY|nr:M20/M25/M40 family metallo-hydrolase [Saccharothrix syringae]QFZ20036.1 M20/M25/M40 family metallo-hydrolase [Saccharothrix syringae]